MGTPLTSAMAFGVLMTAAVAISDMRSTEVSHAPAHPTPANAGEGLQRFVLSVAGSAASCAVTKSEALVDGTSELRIGAGCETVLPGLSKARLWTEAEDGSVTLSTSGSDVLLRFAVADGVAYESYQPAAPLISMSSYD